MATFGTLEHIVMSFPEVTVEPHFEKISFRVRKKIVATHDEKNNRVTVKLSEVDQEHFSSLNLTIYPVDNKWGKQGWTFIELDKVNEGLLRDVLTAAYCEVAPKKLVEIIKQ
ncbi:MmcQ/YjbR family DNA-binding protein [Tenacibaculum singaporense]|uniref:MmcQ/YjbR family DNA-binding protein n=1 Tax=Tenacibaculum singaporense TaxID=2358479 RepID=UPI000F6649DB|nr:MmcQ/YjbR family DNA-binding protein [Tenacibaculum singaporense]RSC93484.1 MmcQ/YjbR family DNA-binding protein [Tenacibaculum singaporense]